MRELLVLLPWALVSMRQFKSQRRSRCLLGYSNTFGGYDGGQAEYLRVPYANVGPVVVPEELSDEQVLFLTDILPTSYWGVEMGESGRMIQW